MNLSKMFELQRRLDEHILDEHPELKGQDNFDWKILALQVELGECANEWRGFKKWSYDQEPRTKVLKFPTMNFEDREYHNPLLEEYVDCLHFVLSIGLELGYEDVILKQVVKEETKTGAFLSVIEAVIDLNVTKERVDYERLVSMFMELGEMLSFTWEQIEQAYIQKNKINHQRQLEGY